MIEWRHLQIPAFTLLLMMGVAGFGIYGQFFREQPLIQEPAVRHEPYRLTANPVMRISVPPVSLFDPGAADGRFVSSRQQTQLPIGVCDLTLPCIP